MSTGATPGGGRTLIIQPLPGIGDMVWHLPHIHAIAATAAAGRVSILTKPRSRADQLLAADPAVENVLWLERGKGRHGGAGGLWRLAADIRRGDFDTVWVLHNSPRYALAAWLAGVPCRIGYARGMRAFFYSRPVRLTGEEERAHPIHKADMLLDRCGLHEREVEPRLVVDKDSVTRVCAAFPSVQPWIGLGIGSSEAFKQWGRERFLELACQLSAQNATLLLIGGPAERGMGEWIMQQAAACGATVHDAMGLSIADTAALLSACRLYVGNDTGFLNMSAALGVTAIGLFGGSPPLQHASRIHCLLPEDGSVPWYGSQFMDRISAEAVLDEVQNCLSDIRATTAHSPVDTGYAQ